MAKYGDHHDQIRRFLSRVKALTESDWNAAAAAQALTYASFGSRSYHSLEGELRWYKKFGVDGGERLIAQAYEDAGIGRNDIAPISAKVLLTKQGLVLDALNGLCHLSEVSVVDFTRAYLPFQDKIPIETLGFRDPPRVLAASETVEGRFATRVLALDASDWDDAIVISKFVDDLTDAETVDEAWAQFMGRAATMEAGLASALNAALETLEEIGNEHLRQMSRIYQGMAKVISRDDWVESRMQEHRDQVAVVRGLARRALLALALIAEIDERTFATFYAPFGTLIPFESL